MKDLPVPFYEIAHREIMAQEVTVSEEEAKIIEACDRETIGYIHLMQNVKGKRYRAKLDEG